MKALFKAAWITMAVIASCYLSLMLWIAFIKWAGAQ